MPTGVPAIDNLETQVASNVTVEGSATTLINGFQAQLAAGIANALAGGATATQLTDLNTLNTNLQASAALLAAAVAANTPAAPPAGP